MIKLTVEQRAALEVAKIVGIVTFFGACTILALKYFPFWIIMTVSLGFLIIAALVSAYDAILARLIWQDEMNRSLADDEK